MGAASPFVDDVAQLITQSHAQRVRLVAEVPAGDLELDVLDYSVDWDETRSPRVQGSFDVPVPESQSQLDLLDPRTCVPVRVLVAYRLLSGEWDEQQVAKLWLRNRRVRRDDGAAVLTLDVASVESMWIDAAGPNPSSTDGTFTQPSLTEAVESLTADLFAGTPLAGVAVEGPTFGGPITVPLAPHPWDALADVADQLDATIYDNGDETIRVALRRTEVAADAVLALSVGTNGTILDSDSRVSRDDWANWVSVWYTWSDAAGVQQVAGGYANVVSGPFAVADAGYKILTVEKSMKGDAATATRQARSTLRRLLARSRSYTVTAVPAWWVRPEQTITLQLPLGSQERHLVSRVGFRPGAMTIETRLPDSASVIGE